MQYVVLRGPTRSAGRTSHTILPAFCPFTSVWFYRFHELAGIRQFCSCTTIHTHRSAHFHFVLSIFSNFFVFFLLFFKFSIWFKVPVVFSYLVVVVAAIRFCYYFGKRQFVFQMVWCERAKVIGIGYNCRALVVFSSAVAVCILSTPNEHTKW